MKCARCGLENPPVAVFCMRCGQQLQAIPTGRPSATPASATPTSEKVQGSPQRPQQPTQPLRSPQPSPHREPLRSPPSPGAPSPESEEDLEREAWEKLREPVPEFPVAGPVSPAPPKSELAAQLTAPLEIVERESPFSPPPSRPPDKIVCPNCYAVNAPGNNFCRECGNPLPKPTTPAVRPMPPMPPQPPGHQPTLSMPPVYTGPLPPAAPSVQGVPGQPVSGEAVPVPARSRTFGPADALGILALLAIILSIVPLFKWTRISGRNIWAFTYQGPATAASGSGFPGGPGILPYSGFEWLTMGALASIAGALVLAFLIARIGRGSMFMLAGCICLFPFVYHLTQSLVPLREQGIEFTKSIGFKTLFFGASGTPYQGLGPPVWFLLGAAILLIVAGFLAPPRAITRLLTFFLFLLAIIVLAAFAAVSYNFNLFIPQAVILGLGAG